MVDKKKQGKKNRKSGAAFELLVRKDLEKNGWIVSKWNNNVEFDGIIRKNLKGVDFKTDEIKHFNGRLIPAKRKFNPFNKALSLGTGFPDFIIYRMYTCGNCIAHGFGTCSREVWGVEAKSNGYLDKEEKDKCAWLLENHIFSKILIAKKGKDGEIIYTEFSQPQFPMEIDNKI